MRGIDQADTQPMEISEDDIARIVEETTEQDGDKASKHKTHMCAYVPWYACICICICIY